MSSCSAAGFQEEELPEPDYDHLDLSFKDEEDDDDLKKGLEKQAVEPQYILGTLVVRVVAARNLQPAPNGGLEFLLQRSTRDRNRASNPYAVVRFSQQTQRTTEVFDTRDPIWPRGETMYFDCALPLSRVTHEEHDSKAVPPVAAAAAAVDVKEDADEEPLPQPILTVALFHATQQIYNNERYPTKKNNTQMGDSNEPFLGMTSIDVTPVLTGKLQTLDRWLPLTGTANDSSKATVRVVCEYEASDPPPGPGDVVRFTQFCNKADLYPVPPGQAYSVQEVNGDDLIISYTTPEGWLCTFQAHRFMVLCEERHHGAMEVAQEELASLAERLGRSPMLHAVTETVDRLPDEGLVSVGAHAFQEGAALLGRWMNGGVETAVGDLIYATNWDGRFNDDESVADHPGPQLIPSDSAEEDIGDPLQAAVARIEPDLPSEEDVPEAIPGMPCCPITGEPMRDPVVAADGHTYERSAIARWLRTSDKSPLTGNVLPHKELVTNYGLLTSVQEAALKSAEKDYIE